MMDAREIKANLLLRGITQVEIARRLGVTKTWVSLIVNHKASSERVQRYIARLLNLPYEQVWGRKEAA